MFNFVTNKCIKTFVIIKISFKQLLMRNYTQIHINFLHYYTDLFSFLPDHPVCTYV